nr:enhancer of mRNA-decapping protein 3-like isoform X2 [Misgurnus anguillicaudatus]
MAEDWLGCLVSINCGFTLGVYQGEVSAVDPNLQSISLRQPFHNGVRCLVPEVTFSAIDIKELKILELGHGRAINCDSTSSSSFSQTVTISPPDALLYRGCHDTKDSSHQSEWRRTETDNVTGGHQESFMMDTNVDLEENQPGFDKSSSVFSESSSSSSWMTLTQNHHNIPVTVTQHEVRKYCTDSGLIITSVSYDVYKRLLAEAERHGLSVERRLETTGVCSSQMALMLLGGPNRLTPKNVHQRPQVVLLCGPHVQGSQGVSCARHLANHDVEVILFLPNCVKMQEIITNELMLFNKTNSRHVLNVRDLPVTPVDLIINCLDSHESVFLKEQLWYQAASKWANQNRAPVLSIDPPVSGRDRAVEAKWWLCLGLPLPISQGEGRIYLCDIGIPQQVFQDVGIDYVSPFGSKFVIPLHTV